MPTRSANPVALFPAPVADVAAEIGATLSGDLLPILTEAIRRANLGEYLDDEGVMRECQLTKRQIRHLRDTRQISFHKAGRTIRYKTADVFAFMEAGRIPARAPVDT